MNHQLKKINTKPVKIVGLVLAIAIAGALTYQFNLFAKNDVKKTQDKDTVRSEQKETAENYTYTVGAGDGITHMIIDFARTKDRDLTPLEAYDIAKAHGQQFLSQGITVPMDAPFTEGIGGFSTVGTVVTATEHPDLFNQIGNKVRPGSQPRSEQPAKNGDNTAEEAEKEDQATENTQEPQKDADSNEADQAGDSFEYRWLILIGAVSAFVWFLLRRRDEDLDS